MRAMPQVDAVIEFMGGTPDEQPRHYDAASPLLQVKQGAPPFLLVHGTDDWFVDAAQTEHMRDRLREVGSQAEMLAVPGGGHILNRGPGGRYEIVITSLDTPDAWLAQLDFLERTLGAP
jgi:dipeptidyl aminopeptidase/acylaminoacyl peptidase